ncbi:SMC family ATPase [Alteromonas gracilis]
MRLHSLSLTAFGPFAETVTVDFDALSDQGLFLLSGPTGSGKSTLLDGVCFALFGRVPGERQAAGHLHSDHAAPGVPPVVALEATIAGRRLLIERSPAWSRPKKRGTGTTTEKARTLLQQRDGGRWVAVTQRADEAGDHLSALLGMTLDQFLQVVLLPQGAFATFLTADAQERQRLLERLFRTEVYREVESRLAQMRRETAAASREHEARFTEALSRLLEAGDRDLPTPLEQEPLVMGPEPVLAWAAELSSTLTRSAETSAGRAAASRHEALAADEVVATARDHAAARHRGLAARADLERLTADDAAAQTATRRLDRAERAAPVLPLASVVHGSEKQLADLERSLSTAFDGLRSDDEGPVRRHPAVSHDVDASHEADDRALDPLQTILRGGDDWDLARLDGVRRAAHAMESALHHLLGLRQDRDRLRDRIAGHLARLEHLAGEASALASRRQELPARVAEVEQRIVETRALIDSRPATEARLRSVQERLVAHQEAHRHARELVEVAARLDEARTARVRADEHLRGVRERRVADMAAELAARLAVGDDCPVCGSAEHPRPAARADDHVDADVEERAQSLLDDADVVWTALRDRHHTLTLQRDRALAIAGDDPDDLHGELDALRAGLDSADAATADLPALESELTRLSDELGAAQRAADDLREQQVAERAVLEDLESRQEHLEQRIVATLEDADLTSLMPADLTTDDVETLRSDHAARVESVDRIRDLVVSITDAREALAAHRARLGDAAHAAGFGSSAEAVAAAMPPDEMIALRQRLATRRAELDRCAAVLAEQAMIEALATSPIDLRAAEEAAATASVRADDDARASHRTAERAARVTELSQDLADLAEAWEPVRRRLEVVTDLASTADGRGEHNAWRISLSSYVLAERLRQVVDAANDRLSVMLPRYVLAHSEVRTGTERRGGLGLVVLDQWSGRPRPAGTLSGGETFVVSLALALGLADVVTAEAGAIDIGTLFVDEGFGSLDSETLDDVLDTLDQLRDGGRVVGLVSHVSEMRERIPAEVRVRPLTHGSTVEVVTG